MIKLSSSWVEIVEKDHRENFESGFAPRYLATNKSK
jgi:hypothetical protein